MSIDERVARVEEAILIMKDLLIRHDDRLDNFYKTMQDSRADFDFKLNALVDAQLKNEEEIVKLNEASRSQLNRIEDLEKNQ